MSSVKKRNMPDSTLRLHRAHGKRLQQLERSMKEVVKTLDQITKAMMRLDRVLR